MPTEASQLRSFPSMLVAPGNFARGFRAQPYRKETVHMDVLLNGGGLHRWLPLWCESCFASLQNGVRRHDMNDWHREVNNGENA